VSVCRAGNHDVAVTAASAALLLAWELAGGDLAVSRWFGTAQGFAWRDHWITADVLHSGARGVGWVLLVLLAINMQWPLSAVMRRLSKGQRARWFTMTLLCVLLVPLVKRASLTSCPWDLAEFGTGLAHYVPHWMLGVRDGGPGGCFPSGHAVTGFAFIGGWFVLRDVQPRAAAVCLAAALLAGSVLGGVQVLRGAHYASHVAWTAWFCWTASWLMHTAASALAGRPARGAATAEP
jgi:membrane-associated PAP2 superfamily phosphatase